MTEETNKESSIKIHQETKDILSSIKEQKDLKSYEAAIITLMHTNQAMQDKLNELGFDVIQVDKVIKRGNYLEV